jgi:hypothetical protein
VQFGRPDALKSSLWVQAPPEPIVRHGVALTLLRGGLVGRLIGLGEGRGGGGEDGGGDEGAKAHHGGLLQSG